MECQQSATIVGSILREFGKSISKLTIFKLSSNIKFNQFSER